MIVDVPTQTIGKLNISNSTSITLRPSNVGNRSLTIGAVASDALTIDSGSSLTIKGFDDSTDRTLTLSLASTTGVEANISGTLKIALDNNVITAAGIFNKGSLAVVYFNNGSIYEHAIPSGTIPSAIWDDGSTCLITG
ncbi:MAG TPA: hypothetical protein VGK46_10060, partial [Saprospiraceae bacterium]